MGVEIGGIYRHFKGEDKLYRLLNVAVNCDTLSKQVVYEQLYDSKDFAKGTVWIRDLEDFVGNKIFEDGSEVKRFKLVENG